MTNVTELKRQFFNSLKRGTGEAHLIAKANPTVDFSGYILKGAVRNFAYDGQSENSRAPYIYELIQLTTKKESIRKAVLEALATEQADTWTLTHLLDLARIYAQQGDQEARQAMYDRFLRNPIEGSDWVGYAEILELDGLDGLIFIAEKMGKRLEQNPDDWQDQAIIRHFQVDHPSIPVLEELTKVAETNAFVKSYLDGVKRTAEHRKTLVREMPSFSDIVDEVIHSQPCISFRRVNELTESDVLVLAKQLLIEEKPPHQEKLLGIFASYPFPFDSDFILRLARQRASSKNRVPAFAIYALKHLKSDRIRQWALDRIPKAKRPADYLDILTSNYQEGDGSLLTTIANKFQDDHSIENLAGSYTEIFKRNKTAECREPLEVLYHKMKCGIHRNGLVEVLMENGVVSEKIKSEIQYDSYLATRELWRIMQNDW